MRFNQAKYDEDHTDSVINPGRDLLELVTELHRAIAQQRRGLGTGSLGLFQGIFGRQQITKNYSHRNRIWTFTSDDGLTTLYVLISVRGASFEYDTTSKAEGLPALMRELLDTISAAVQYSTVGGPRQ